MGQNRYDILCAELAAREVAIPDRLKLVEEIAKSLCARFARFLGFENHQQELVGLCPLKRNENGEPVISDGGSTLLPNSENDLVFWIEVKLKIEPAPAVVLTVPLTCPCSIRTGGQTNELRIADRPKPFAIVPDDPASFEPALGTLYEHFLEWLQWRPWSGRPEPGPQMGFRLKTRAE